MTATDKQEQILALAAQLTTTPAVYVFDHQQLRQEGLDALRDEIRSQGGQLRVVKNTLAAKAAEQSGRREILPFLDGPSALLFAGGDVVKAAATLAASGAKPRGGSLDGQTLDARAIGLLAGEGSTRTLKERLLSVLTAPLAQVGGLLPQRP